MYYYLSDVFHLSFTKYPVKVRSRYKSSSVMSNQVTLKVFLSFCQDPVSTLRSSQAPFKVCISSKKGSLKVNLRSSLILFMHVQGISRSI